MITFFKRGKGTQTCRRPCAVPPAHGLPAIGIQIKGEKGPKLVEDRVQFLPHTVFCLPLGSKYLIVTYVFVHVAKQR